MLFNLNPLFLSLHPYIVDVSAKPGIAPASGPPDVTLDDVLKHHPTDKSMTG